MPKTPAPKKPESDEDPITVQSKSNDYIELKIPKLRFQDTPLSPLWVILLLIFSFLLGMSTMKIMYTQDGIDSLLAQNGTDQQQAPTEPTLGQKVDVDPGNLPILGDENAKVTIVEFSDFQCPFCSRFYTDTYEQIKKEYIDTGKAKFTYRHMPLAIHPLAQDAGEASECANDQGSFWDYHDKLFDSFNQWTALTNETLTDQLVSYAGALGLNTTEFEACLTSDKYDQKVKDDLSDGTAAGVSGTPTFFINGKPLVGAHPFQTFKTLLDQELKNLQ